MAAGLHPFLVAVYHRAVIDDPAILELRKRIDVIDHEILRLLAERLAVVHDVGEQKRQKGLAVFDPNREERLLAHLVATAPKVFDEQAVRTIFTAIVAESRRLEDIKMNS